MPKQLFITKFPPETNLPGMDAETGLKLHYKDKDGVLCGGFSCIGMVNQSNACIVQIDADAATLTAMAADARYVAVPTENEAAATAGITAIRTKLKAMGLKATDVDAAKLTTGADLQAAAATLCKIPLAAITAVKPVAVEAVVEAPIEDVKPK